MAMLDAQAPDTGAASPVTGDEPSQPSTSGIYSPRGRIAGPFHDDAGGASRFMYCAKTSRGERDAGLPPGFEQRPLNWSSGTQNPGTFQSEGTNRMVGNNHPTVKPIDLMRWLARLVTPPGGLVLDPFMGSGSTGCATVMEGFRFLGADLSDHYVEIAGHRIAYWRRMAAKARAEQHELARAQPLDLFDCL